MFRSCDQSHLGAISCTMAGRWMVGHESLCLSLNISCSFSWESFWLIPACLSSAAFMSCCSFDSCLESQRGRSELLLWMFKVRTDSCGTTTALQETAVVIAPHCLIRNLHWKLRKLGDICEQQVAPHSHILSCCWWRRGGLFMLCSTYWMRVWQLLIRTLRSSFCCRMWTIWSSNVKFFSTWTKNNKRRQNYSLCR